MSASRCRLLTRNDVHLTLRGKYRRPFHSHRILRSEFTSCIGRSIRDCQGKVRRAHGCQTNSDRTFHRRSQGVVLRWAQALVVSLLWGWCAWCFRASWASCAGSHRRHAGERVTLPHAACEFGTWSGAGNHALRLKASTSSIRAHLTHERRARWQRFRAVELSNARSRSRPDPLRGGHRSQRIVLAQMTTRCWRWPRRASPAPGATRAVALLLWSKRPYAMHYPLAVRRCPDVDCRPTCRPSTAIRSARQARSPDRGTRPTRPGRQPHECSCGARPVHVLEVRDPSAASGLRARRCRALYSLPRPGNVQSQQRPWALCFSPKWRRFTVSRRACRTEGGGAVASCRCPVRARGLHPGARGPIVATRSSDRRLTRRICLRLASRSSWSSR